MGIELIAEIGAYLPGVITANGKGDIGSIPALGIRTLINQGACGSYGIDRGGIAFGKFFYLDAVIVESRVHVVPQKANGGITDLSWRLADLGSGRQQGDGTGITDVNSVSSGNIIGTRFIPRGCAVGAHPDPEFQLAIGEYPLRTASPKVGESAISSKEISGLKGFFSKSGCPSLEISCRLVNTSGYMVWGFTLSWLWKSASARVWLFHTTLTLISILGLIAPL